jgi:hypothetical protein
MELFYYPEISPRYYAGGVIMFRYISIALSALSSLLAYFAYHAWWAALIFGATVATLLFYIGEL